MHIEILRDKVSDIAASVQDNPHEAADKVLQLTNSYSTDVSLKKRALKLNWDLDEVKAQVGSYLPSAIKDELTDILDTVLTRSENDPTQIQYHENRKLTRRQFIAESTEQDLIFKGSGISYEYGHGDFTLHPYDIELHLGEITAVVGENSSGKSTLIKVVAGEHLPRTGDISYPLFTDKVGVKIDWCKVKEKIAYIPQQLEPWSGVVKDYLHFTLTIKGVTGQDNLDEVDYIIQRLDLREFSNRTWNELSGGARMRVELARAFLWKPKLLILDEPLANLDINAQAIFLRDLKQLSMSHKNPVSVLMTSQHLYEMENISDRTIFLKKGVSDSNSIGEVIYNDLTENFGKLRTNNSYEVSSKTSIDKIRSELAKVDIRDVTSHGQYLIIKCGLDIGPKKMLSILVTLDIDINYFRDISKSTRILFEGL